MSFGFGLHGQSAVGLPATAPVPPPRPAGLPKAVDTLKSFDDIYAPKVLTLNNYWGLRQDFKHPWKGTPRYDGFDGNSDGTYAVFADPRFAARAIAIALADWQAEEKTLAAQLASLEAAPDHSSLLTSLAELAQPLEAFFTAVMVKCEDPALRAARLSLLHRLRQAFLRVADFSQWQ